MVEIGAVGTDEEWYSLEAICNGQSGGGAACMMCSPCVDYPVAPCSPDELPHGGELQSILTEVFTLGNSPWGMMEVGVITEMCASCIASTLARDEALLLCGEPSASSRGPSTEPAPPQTDTTSGMIDCSDISPDLPCHAMLLVDELSHATSLQSIDKDVFCPCNRVRTEHPEWSPVAAESCSGGGR